ncbi:MAG TPA: 23S rRNA (adenine(2503)-C(2))-methyltransferase RlmN [Polyangiaceae bacterium]|nr:23S rRNA (adenine(2503)-C(2))-methyltransferase RlmN [Polyangiaceae bacterium]
MTSARSALELDCSGWSDWLRARGESPAHAGALFARFQRGRPSTQPLPERVWAAASELREPALRVVDETPSAESSAQKFLLELGDGQSIETVLMEYPGRATVCVSTQAGCAMGCTFCATAQMGFARQLRVGEIVAQVAFVRDLVAARGERLRNLVTMGMGEPLANYEAVIGALDLLCDNRGLGLAPRHVTLNTVGVVPGIVRLADERRPYHLGVSLHGASDEARSRVVPVGKRWPLRELLDSCRYWSERTGRHVFFAWTLIEGVNDGAEDARALVELLRGVPAHVNLIRLNPTAGYDGREPSEHAARTFQETVRAAGLPCTIRRKKGVDVAAGCGQLRTTRLARRDRPARQPATPSERAAAGSSVAKTSAKST